LPDLRITDLTASYAGKPVLRGVNIAVANAEIVALIGPSGSGKSTLLKVLVGLLKPDRGEVVLDGTLVDYNSKKSIWNLRSRCAIVFQQYNLFQNMTVLDNITVAPMKIRKRPSREVLEEALALLTKVGLQDKLKAYPDELSGGQQQRVAIARALAMKPEILLLDEVTSALDPELVNDVLEVIRQLALDGMTMLIVSHEMGFVREVATRVVLMSDGGIVEEGSPSDVFDQPRSQRARDFVGKILRH
jgi:polar amino acid transport system ATP-binding protein